MPPNGGHIAHYLHPTIMAPEREAERGVLIPLGELNVQLLMLMLVSTLVLGGLELSYPRETTGLR